jgi:hypothetical protein
MIRAARADGVDVEMFGRIFAREPEPADPAEPIEPPACAVRMPFGRHRGETLGEIARENLAYVQWLANGLVDRQDLRGAAATVLDYFTGRDG